MLSCCLSDAAPDTSPLDIGGFAILKKRLKKLVHRKLRQTKRDGVTDAELKPMILEGVTELEKHTPAFFRMANWKSSNLRAGDQYLLPRKAATNTYLPFGVPPLNAKPPKGPAELRTPALNPPRKARHAKSKQNFNIQRVHRSDEDVCLLEAVLLALKMQPAQFEETLRRLSPQLAKYGSDHLKLFAIATAAKTEIRIYAFSSYKPRAKVHALTHIR